MISISEMVENPSRLSLLSNEEAYTMPLKDVEELQQRLLTKRFDELLPRISVVSRIAEDAEIKSIDSPSDIASLCLPHTFYKSYNAADVDKGRFDRLTRWLGSLTAFDLSKVDVSACDSLESWLAAVQAQTQIRPLCSSGTSGKISFFPRSTVEELYFIRNYQLFVGGFRNELDSNLASGEVDVLYMWPFATGNHNFPIKFRLLRDNVFKGKPGEHVHVSGKAHWSTDVMWLTARFHAAKAKGDLSSAAEFRSKLNRIQDSFIVSAADQERDMDEFIHELVVNQRGRKILLFAVPNEFYALTLECEKRGVKPDLHPDSYLLVPGRANYKGGNIPDTWIERCKAMFPFDYQGLFGMTELTAGARLCPAGYFHLPPWIHLALLDPDTSQPYPRTGLQTGRLALFDLLAETYWGGTISGDRVTINWGGGCSCGRVGPYIHNDIVRYSNLKDDDKISCAKTPDAYEKAVEYVIDSISN